MKSHTMNENYFQNPIKILHRLKEAGFTQKQAETQVEILSDYVEHGLATKKDLKETETSIRKDFELRLKDLEFRLTVKTAGVVGSIVGVFSILEKIIK